MERREIWSPCLEMGGLMRARVVDASFGLHRRRLLMWQLSSLEKQDIRGQLYSHHSGSSLDDWKMEEGSGKGIRLLGGNTGRKAS
jgi:hypothetical protein